MSLYADRILPWLIDRALDAEPVAEQRAALLRGLAGEVLEVGFGTGLSLAHYPGQVRRLYTFDPSHPPLKRVARRIAAAPFPVTELAFDPARPYPLANGAVDAVASMFSLCTIPRPEAALAEIFRVLKPGGRFVFLEHGLAETAGKRWWQRRLTPCWAPFTGGCHMDRDIAALVAAAGFREARHERVAMRGIPPVMGRLYRGVAVKGV
jgi:SAM-dependent methyltransferase